MRLEQGAPICAPEAFHLVSKWKPSSDQKEAILSLMGGLHQDHSHQTLHGVTGSGKTFTIANVIAAAQRPALVIAPNKTLADQLYAEFRAFFPQNAVCYFSSPYVSYRPETYRSTDDSHSGKLSRPDHELQAKRTAAKVALQTRRDVIVVSTPTCIFPLGRTPLTAAAIGRIRAELSEQVAVLRSQNRPYEAARLQTTTSQDINALTSNGTCRVIENYAMHLDGRRPGDPPSTLLDEFPAEFLTFVDESHLTLPLLKSLETGNRLRLQKLVEHGIRLPSAMESRPLTAEEFDQKAKPVIYVSATPGIFERNKSGSRVVEQIVRPTGVVDPAVEVHPKRNQYTHLAAEIIGTWDRKEQSLVAAISKIEAEKVRRFLNDRGLEAEVLHGDLDRQQRADVFTRFRQNRYPALIGINLLREGLDLPAVSLVTILDADRSGFLRDETSLIQLIGRAARNINGRVLMFANEYTDAIDDAIRETRRRRTRQLEINQLRGITSQSHRKV